MFHQPSLWDTTKSTCSQALACGPTPSASRAGQTTARSGPDLAHASLSARQAREQGLLTSGTSGRPCTGSSIIAGLSWSLASRLQDVVASRGSTWCRLTWKQATTPLGQSLPRLAASAHRTSESGFTGLPTPSGTSNHGKNHVAGRLDEWGGSSNPFRGTEIGKVHSPSFEAWMMGVPVLWVRLMRSAMPSSRRKRQRS